MSSNELMHNTDGVGKKPSIEHNAAAKIVTFMVNGNGVVTGDADANVGDYIKIVPDPSFPYTGQIVYALLWSNTGWAEACTQLMGGDYLNVDQGYPIQESARNSTFSFTTSAVYGAMLTSTKANTSIKSDHHHPRPAGANGTLRVGSGSPPVIGPTQTSSR